MQVDAHYDSLVAEQTLKVAKITVLFGDRSLSGGLKYAKPSQRMWVEELKLLELHSSVMRLLLSNFAALLLLTLGVSIAAVFS